MYSGIEFNHPDLLDELNKKVTVSEKVIAIHQFVRQSCDFVHRIGVAVYEPESDLLKTFVHSTDTGNPLSHYQAKLSKATSLLQIHLEGRPRIVNDLSVFDSSENKHAKKINSHGYRSSYTIPMYQDEQLTGFIFFNSRSSGVFHEENLPYLDTIARLISLLVSVELNHVKTLHGALKTATSFSCHRDPETGAHLERMAHFSRIIANKIAPDYNLDDETVERIFWFAQMHDIGKIAIPDYVLLKPAKLTNDEFELMKTHTTKGREIINAMLKNFTLNSSPLIHMLGNIVECHHENIDGSGYPNGLQGKNIPIEARIIAVADVFDALTSERPYKHAWSNKDAFAELEELSTWKLDRECVDALIENGERVEEIQTLFQDKERNDQQFPLRVMQ
ncbi:MAG: HD domain-containing phosphohydrolase [Sedimenticola sp.]